MISVLCGKTTILCLSPIQCNRASSPKGTEGKELRDTGRPRPENSALVSGDVQASDDNIGAALLQEEFASTPLQTRGDPPTGSTEAAQSTGLQDLRETSLASGLSNGATNLLMNSRRRATRKTCDTSTGRELNTPTYIQVANFSAEL